MDKIEIRVESFNGEAVTKPWSAVFGLAGGTIGRGGQNKLVLPDPDAHVARVHAMVRLETDKALIANLCERRAIVVGGQELPSGQETVLPIGTQVHVGPYRLRALRPGTPWQAAGEALPAAAPPPAAAAAALDENPFAFIGRVEASPSPPAAAPSPRAAPAPAPPGALLIPDDFDPFARDIEQERRDKDPWAGGLPMHNLAEMAPLRDELLRSLPAIDRVDQPSPLERSAVKGLPASLDPQMELDPLRLFESAPTLPGLPPDAARLLHGSELGQALRLPREAAMPAAEAPVIAPVIAPMITPAIPPAIPSSITPPPPPAPLQAAGLHRVDGLDLTMFDRAPGALPAGGGEPPVAPEATIFSNIDANLTSTQLLPMRAPVPLPQVPTLAVVAPGLDLDLDGPAPTPFDPPAAAAAPPVPVDPAPAPAMTSAADLQALMQAFIEGIGLPPERVKSELTPEFMQRVGQTFRTAIQGTMDLLHARSEIKREFRADVTIMANRANNPLKFLPDADGVMMQMFGQTFPGFMRPVPAMQEAYRDLRVHQLALMAGIRAAYAEALTRFDPAELERQAGDPGGLLARLGRNRHKAALWDDYKQRYAEIRRNAEDDLTAFSGRTFVKAYDAAADAALDEDELLLRKKT
ncbi:MAG: type VI secretion system-associated FHA domain protein TagH [Proteobacteria bacterium]|nr:type VI secretion system-associated FHA domain protein TagH [Pseudomonadota bacterium]